MNGLNVTFVTPDRDLSRRLMPIARRIFAETFGSLYDQSSFDAFCDNVYLPGGSMENDLKNSDIFWHVAIVDDEPIGFAKLTPLRAPAINASSGAMELQQIYVLPDWHGTGTAQALLEWAVATAIDRHAPELYLTVFDHNERAKRFYKKNGFSEVGRCTFQLGNRIDDDRIWCRDLRKDTLNKIAEKNCSPTKL